MTSFVLNGDVEVVDNPGRAIGEIFLASLQNSQCEKSTILVDEATKQCYTTLDLYRKSLRVAKRLQEFGVRANDVVGIVADNRVDYIWTVLACFYIGAAINPLNPDYVAREIKHAFEISRPKFVIAESHKIPHVTEATSRLENVPTLISFDDFKGDEEQLKEFELSLSKVALDPLSANAVILCSSGTTGLPKGVALNHLAINNCLHHIQSKSGIDVTEKDTIIAVLPFYHILGLLVVLSSILFRAKVIVLPKFKPKTFVGAIETHRVTKLFIVPPLALFLAKTPLEFDATSITDVFCGAAPLGPETQCALEAKLGVAVRQMYGMTETCAVSVCPRKGAPAGSSGKLLANVQAKVVPIETGLALGPKERGELCVKSPCLMQYYVGNREATDAIFDEDGYVHTGDIAYYDDDGYIFIVDRLKELIKYKGFQVAPAEIEDVLIMHSEIRDAAVIAVKDDRAGELARAFVVTSEASKLTPKAVQEWVAKHLSVQKWLHGGVEFIQAIPRSAAGKIQRKELKLLTEH